MKESASLAGPFASYSDCAKAQQKTSGATGCEHLDSPQSQTPRHRYQFQSPGAKAGEAIEKYFDEEAARARLDAPTVATGATLSRVLPQPARIYVEGGPKETKAEVLALVRKSHDLPVSYAKKSEANIDLEKSGGAKCEI